MALPRVFAVDCGAGHITAGQITTDKAGNISLESLACDAINPDPASDGEWIGMISNSLNENARAQKQSGVAVLGLPGHHILGKFIKIPSIEESKRAKIVQFEAQQNIPYALNEVVWDYEVVSEHGLDLELMLAAVKQDLVQGACDVLSKRGLGVVSVLPSSVAVARCFRYNYPEVKGSTNLIFIDDTRFFVRTIPLAGNSVTQAIADELKLDFTHSEMTKVQVLTGVSDLPVNAPTRGIVQNAVNGFIGKLHLEITRSIVNYRRQSGAEQPTVLYLTGGGSVLAALSGQLQERLKMTVEPLDPLRKVQVGAGAAQAVEFAPLLAGLVGLAASGSGLKSVNLLPAKMMALLEFKKRQPVLIFAAALIALAMIPPLVQSFRHLSAARTQLDALNKDIMPLQVLQERIKANTAEFDAAIAEINAIQSLAESKNNWINFLSDLQAQLVEVQDVWLDSLQVIRPTAGESGGLFGAAPVANTTPAADGTTPAKPVIRLKLSGRLIDRKNPVSKVSTDSYTRIKSLLTSFSHSKFIASVEKDSYDPNTPGILRFDFIMVIDPARPL
jgi:type IV pilus assembly protein PilM